MIWVWASSSSWISSRSGSRAVHFSTIYISAEIVPDIRDAFSLIPGLRECSDTENILQLFFAIQMSAHCPAFQTSIPFHTLKYGYTLQHLKYAYTLLYPKYAPNFWHTKYPHTFLHCRYPYTIPAHIISAHFPTFHWSKRFLHPMCPHTLTHQISAFDASQLRPRNTIVMLWCVHIYIVSAPSDVPYDRRCCAKYHYAQYFSMHWNTRSHIEHNLFK